MKRTIYKIPENLIMEEKTRPKKMTDAEKAISNRTCTLCDPPAVLISAFSLKRHIARRHPEDEEDKKILPQDRKNSYHCVCMNKVTIQVMIDGIIQPKSVICMKQTFGKNAQLDLLRHATPHLDKANNDRHNSPCEKYVKKTMKERALRTEMLDQVKKHSLLRQQRVSLLQYLSTCPVELREKALKCLLKNSCQRAQLNTKF